MQFITDFADQAVVQPSAVLVAAILALLGWRRGALAWVATVVASFGLVLLLKLGLGACGSPLPHELLRSPSGHTMAGTVVYGGLLALFGLGISAATVAALAIAALIGWSRVALGAHTAPEVLVGAFIGVTCVPALARLAGPHPPHLLNPPPLRIVLLAMVVLAPALLLHGRKSHSESMIQQIAQAYVGALLGCKPSARE